MVKIKICGLRNLEDAIFAAENGADYLGFNFYKESLRYIKPETAAEIIERLPINTKIIGVFVNQSKEEIQNVFSACSLSYAQLHGDESAEFAKSLALPVIKAFRLNEHKDLEGIDGYDVFAYLFDSYNENFYGGTGERFDMSLLKGKYFKKKIFLSGGIGSQNVREAIKEIMPFAVDVCSGVEKAPGIKDQKKITDLIKALRKPEKF